MKFVILLLSMHAYIYLCKLWIKRICMQMDWKDRWRKRERKAVQKSHNKYEDGIFVWLYGTLILLISYIKSCCCCCCRLFFQYFDSLINFESAYELCFVSFCLIFVFLLVSLFISHLLFHSMRILYKCVNLYSP